jgi:hypothetical protein
MRGDYDTTMRGRDRLFMIVIGLAFIAVMAIPFACSESGGCRLGIVTPWSAFNWPEKSAIAIFVCAGIVMILRGLGLRTLASLVGLGLLPLFAIMFNAVLFGLRAPACGPIIGGMRALAEIPAYPACALWPTLTALWIDAFFIGFTLEIARKEFLPASIGKPLKRWTQGLLLLSLSPFIVLLVLLMLPTVGSEVVRERWRRWWNS